ncbi:anthranilate phosphoribosyltransferase, partial [Flavobacteriaceae bacterium]|nr:anthranilate phosphoribosyltransferase [Flavobacteriaceae bacterium]
ESVPSAAAIFVDILSGKGTDAQNNVVCANAAVAILTAFEQAKETLLSGAALKKLQQLQAL